MNWIKCYHILPPELLGLITSKIEKKWIYHIITLTDVVSECLSVIKTFKTNPFKKVPISPKVDKNGQKFVNLCLFVKADISWESVVFSE